MAVLAIALAILMPVTSVKAATVATPSGLSQTAATATAVQYSWKPVTGATQYGCSYSVDGSTWSNEVVETSTMHVFNGLTAGKTYYVKVRAFGAGAWGAYSASYAVSTSPKVVTTVSQTEVSTSSVTVTWSAVEGVSGYNVWIGKAGKQTKLVKATAGTTTSLTINGLTPDTKYTVEVVPFIKSQNGFLACGEVASNKKVVTLGGAVKKFKLKKWNPVTGDFTFSWKNSAKYESGYQVELISAKGKSLKAFDVNGNVKEISFTSRKLMNKAGKARVRTYKVLGDKKFYGDWSKEIVIVPQAAAVATKTAPNTVTLNWKKVSGASSYAIYYSTNPNGGYTKLADVGGATSYSFANLDATTTYYAFVVANNVKVGKKNFKSNALSVKTPVVVSIAPQQ